jgi:hypothetical protein
MEDIDMDMEPVIPASEFTRNFGRYQMLAQREVLAVSSHGRVTGYFIAADEYEAFKRFRGQRRSFATAELSEAQVTAIASSRMSSEHDHLNALLDGESTS